MPRKGRLKVNDVGPFHPLFSSWDPFSKLSFVFFGG